jgi:hypothetical protein
MSPMDPRLNALRTRALMWDRSLDWFEEPDEISLEIIPPTHWPETVDMGGMGAVASAALGLGTEGATAGSRGRDPATECRALAILAAALLQAAHAR